VLVVERRDQFNDSITDSFRSLVKTKSLPAGNVASYISVLSQAVFLAHFGWKSRQTVVCEGGSLARKVGGLSIHVGWVRISNPTT